MKPHIKYMSNWGWTCKSRDRWGYGMTLWEAYETWESGWFHP